MIHFEEPLISWLILTARLCLAAVYLVSGLHKAICYQEAVTEFHNARVPATGLLLPLTIILHLLASVALASGVYASEAALLLAAFTAVATVRVHRFWQMKGPQRLAQSRVALAHLAIIGGLILLAAVGPGRLVVPL
ncbi:MAG: DoxX family protein [Proteobacteria bacterium]|nr:DoxX family protein [Pseudomonadota bacterium]